MLLTSHSETTAAEALQPALFAHMDNSVAGSDSQSPVSGELDDLFAQLEAEISTAPPVEPPAPEGDRELEGIERREAERRTLDQFSGNLRLTVPGAADAKPIDLSETGFLLETSNRLRPGSVVEVFLRFNGNRQVLRAAIVRSVVHSLTPKPLFRTAFKFEVPTKLPERP